MPVIYKVINEIYIGFSFSLAQGIGDLTLAYQCFKLALAFNNNHGEAYNNLAVLELRKGRIEQVRFFPSSLVIANVISTLVQDQD